MFRLMGLLVSKAFGISKPISYADFADSVADTLDKGWTRYWYAVDKRGLHVNSGSRRAAKYCASGAINLNYRRLKNRIEGEDLCGWICTFEQYLRTTEYESCLKQSRPTGSLVVYWNDRCANLDQDKVVKTFRDFANKERESGNQRYLISPKD